MALNELKINKQRQIDQAQIQPSKIILKKSQIQKKVLTNNGNKKKKFVTRTSASHNSSQYRDSVAPIIKSPSIEVAQNTRRSRNSKVTPATQKKISLKGVRNPESVGSRMSSKGPTLQTDSRLNNQHHSKDSSKGGVRVGI